MYRALRCSPILFWRGPYAHFLKKNYAKVRGDTSVAKIKKIVAKYRALSSAQMEDLKKAAAVAPTFKFHPRKYKRYKKRQLTARDKFFKQNLAKYNYNMNRVNEEYNKRKWGQPFRARCLFRFFVFP